MNQSKPNPGVGVRSWLAGTPRSLLNVELSERSPDLRHSQTVLVVDGSCWQNGRHNDWSRLAGHRFSGLQNGGRLAFRRKDVRSAPELSFPLPEDNPIP